MQVTSRNPYFGMAISNKASEVLNRYKASTGDISDENRRQDYLTQEKYRIEIDEGMDALQNSNDARPLADLYLKLQKQPVQSFTEESERDDRCYGVLRRLNSHKSFRNVLHVAQCLKSLASSDTLYPDEITNPLVERLEGNDIMTAQEKEKEKREIEYRKQSNWGPGDILGA